MLAQKDDVINDASSTIYQLTQEEKIRLQCEAREDYYRRQNYVEEEFARKEAALAEKDAEIAEKDAVLAEKDAALAEKDAALAERDAALTERNAALTEKDAALAEKDAEIARLKKLLLGKDVQPCSAE